MKIIRSAELEDLRNFLNLAETEGWQVSQVERQLFQNKWLRDAFVMEEDDRFCGFVTAVTYQLSGWIGNLIVPDVLRGHGYGSTLFDAALNNLEERNLSSIWLTASEMGRPIYEKAGFVKIDKIERWVADKHSFGGADAAMPSCPFAQLRRRDRQVWGESRSMLLDALSGWGQAFACNESVAFLQREPDLQIVGPWYSSPNGLNDDRFLLQTILASVNPDIEIVIDVVASSPVRHLLDATGFDCVGSNSLMARGDVLDVGLSEVVSLASLGSIG